jgi:hypothetical protein
MQHDLALSIPRVSLQSKMLILDHVQDYRTCSRETTIQVNSNSQRASEPEEDEHHINKNQGRGKI